MNDERWEELVYKISLKSRSMEHNVDTQDEGRTKVETVLFDVGTGAMKLERVSKPVVIDKKMRYSKRIGGDTSTEYVYSETDKSYRVTLYRWNADESAWEEVDFRKTLF